MQDKTGTLDRYTDERIHMFPIKKEKTGKFTTAKQQYSRHTAERKTRKVNYRCYKYMNR